MLQLAGACQTAAVVVGDGLLDLGSYLVEGIKPLPVETLDDVIAVRGFDRLGNLAVFQSEAGSLKFGYHLPGAEPVELAAVALRSGIVALDHGDGFKVAPVGHKGINGVDLSLLVGCFLVAEALSELEDMLSEHHTLGGTGAVDLHDMPSEGGGEHLRDSAYGSGVCHIFKRSREASGSDEAHTAAVARSGAVDREAACHVGKVGCTVEDGGADRVETLALHLRFVALPVVRQHDVAYVYLGLHALVDSVDNAVLYFLAAHVRLGEIAAIAVKFVFKCLGFVYLFAEGVGHLLFVGDKHVEILVDSLRGNLLTVVLVVKILKFAKGHRPSVDGHQHGIRRAFSLDQCGRCHK